MSDKNDNASINLLAEVSFALVFSLTFNGEYRPGTDAKRDKTLDTAQLYVG